MVLAAYVFGQPHDVVVVRAEDDVSREPTGYERGTITPFGSTTAWPVVADTRVTGTISIGAGAHGVAAALDAADVVRVLDAQVADVTEAPPNAG